jgi:hypothetical protein
MSPEQTVFTVVFAIAWGTEANVLARWKPFHFAMWWNRKLWAPTWRILLSFVMLNLVPAFLFILVLCLLPGGARATDEWPRDSLWWLIVSVIQGMIPFGCYRTWMAILQFYPQRFYARKQDEVPHRFRRTVPSDNKTRATDPILLEPDMEYLRLDAPGAERNLIFGLLYIAIPLGLLFCACHSAALPESPAAKPLAARVFRCKSASVAANLERVLWQLVENQRTARVSIADDPRTNSVIVFGDGDAVEVVSDVIRQLSH